MKRIKLHSIIICCVLISAGIALSVTGAHCPFLSLTGIPCPGCGMTRAVQSLLRLDFSSAWHYNPLCFLLPVLLLTVLFDGKIFKSRSANAAVCITLAAAVALSYTAKLLAFFAS